MDCYQDLRGLERGGHDIDEEFACGNAPATCRACQLQLGFQRDNDRRPVGRGIRICQRTANRTAIADLRIGNQVGGLAEDRQHLMQRFGREQLGMCREGSDSDALANLDALQFVDAAYIDQQCRRCQSQFQRRDQRVASGNELAAVGVLQQQVDGVDKRFCTNVVERCGNHRAAPVRAFWIADQTRGGVKGMSRCFIPNGESASSTA